MGVIALLLQVDSVVHVQLYEFGLYFDYEWATPYWTFLRLSLGLLGCIVGLNIFSALLAIWQSRNIPIPEQAKPASQKQTIAKPKLEPELPAPTPEPQVIPKEIRREKSEDDGVEIMSLPIVCNKCGKVFTQPLCMFDFKSGKPRLVNLCPYCNTILAVSGNSRE